MKANLFETVKTAGAPRSTFDLSHNVKFSMKQGTLTPVMAMEIVPGDHIKGSVDSLIRFAPLIAPVMHRYKSSIHYWFVPYRLVWPNWQKFITSTMADDTPVLPTLICAGSGNKAGSLYDYLGGGVADEEGVVNVTVNALHFAAYQMIYNEKYRDQNLIDPVNYILDDGDNTDNASELVQLRRRAWEHDYFTSCLPFAQKGDTVDIPVGDFTDVPVEFDLTSGHSGRFRRSDGLNFTGEDDKTVGANTATSTVQHPDMYLRDTSDGSDPQAAVYDPNGTLLARTSELMAEAATINNLRLAVQLQKYFEAAARGGTRYYEWVKSMFGVTPSDARFQQPEFLGGSVSNVVVSEVLQNSETSETPQGNMAGHGYSIGSGKQFSRYFEEYGVVIGIMNVQPEPAYQQGMPRSFSRRLPTDFYNPYFANLGEQEVLTREIFCTGLPQFDDVLFGYNPRFSEYKYMPSRSAGQFKTTLNFWTATRIFDAGVPALNGNFVTADPTKRVFADEDTQDDELWCQVFNNIVASRPMPFYGTPAGL